MSALTDVTLVLSNTPSKALHQALTGPVTDDGQALAMLDTTGAGGSKVYCGTIYAACFNHVLADELETFFRGIPVGAWGSTQGIVMVEGEAVMDERGDQRHGFMVNRVGWQG